jgi:hypothetical protein
MMITQAAVNGFRTRRANDSLNPTDGPTASC